MIIQRRLRNGDWRHVHSGNRLYFERSGDGLLNVTEYGIDQKTGDPTAVCLILTPAEVNQIARFAKEQKPTWWDNGEPRPMHDVRDYRCCDEESNP